MTSVKNIRENQITQEKGHQHGNDPGKNDPFKKDTDNDPTRIQPGKNEPEKSDPTRIDPSIPGEEKERNKNEKQDENANTSGPAKEVEKKLYENLPVPDINKNCHMSNYEGLISNVEKSPLISGETFFSQNFVFSLDVEKYDMKKSKALIIDDEEDICLLLKANLSKKFKEVHYALNLKDGLASLKNNEIQILFLDNNLPDGSGIDHIQEFKSRNPGLIVVIISAMTNLHDKAIAGGASEFLAKPISFKVIRDLLTRYYP